MPIETRIPNDEINIKDLKVETPEDFKPVFDSEKAFTGEEWQLMKEDLGEWAKENLDIYFDFLCHLKSLRPNEDLGLTDKDWEKAIALLDASRVNEYRGFGSTAANIKTLFPQRFRDQEVVNNKDLAAFMKRLSAFRENYLAGGNDTDLKDYASAAYSMKVIDPVSARPLIEDEKMRKAILDPKELNKWRGSSWRAFADYAALVKMLYPNSANDFKITEREWDAMKQELLNQKASAKTGKTFWPNVARHAESLKILAADELQFTDKGLEIISNPKIESDQNRSLPEIKKF